MGYGQDILYNGAYFTSLYIRIYCIYRSDQDIYLNHILYSLTDFALFWNYKTFRLRLHRYHNIEKILISFIHFFFHP